MILPCKWCGVIVAGDDNHTDDCLIRRLDYDAGKIDALVRLFAFEKERDAAIARAEKAEGALSAAEEALAGILFEVGHMLERDMDSGVHADASDLSDIATETRNALAAVRAARRGET